ncbi:MAG: LCP family protein [Candidatus Dormibacteraeota bacterium]|uniref:LCP family protein n=1 Tax=Candidatus Amunia macphersoniae TaxID=3127014 RepID=A0A934KFX1_9BACT|nr:LCP family protein [Candidatus Dormibacteraeota bacterium]
MSAPEAPWHPRRQHRIRRSRPRRRLLAVLGIAFGFVLSGMLGAGLYFSPAIAAAFQDFGRTIHHQPTSARSPAARGVPAAAPASIATSTSAFTVLLLGSDNDAKFPSDAVLTQSMILARVDPVTKQVTMVSIPRDLNVPLSTGGTDKIDKAYQYGGVDAAINTVEQDFNVHVDHYAWIGLLGLVRLIDQVGGVDVVASNPVLDDFYPKDLTGSNPYDFERVAVLPGPQHMGGLQALQYVRSRHDDLRSDFGRSVRQQQVLLALRAKAKLLGVADLPDIANAMSSQFTTDLSLAQVGELLPIAGNVSLSNVQQVVLLPPYTSSQTIGDQEVLVPNWSLILPLVHKYFPQR